MTLFFKNVNVIKDKRFGYSLDLRRLELWQLNAMSDPSLVSVVEGEKDFLYYNIGTILGQLWQNWNMDSWLKSFISVNEYT